MRRKIFRNGNSLVVALPRKILDDLGFQAGSMVLIALDQQSRRIVIRSGDELHVPLIENDFAQQVNEFIEEYRPALQTLANYHPQ